MRRKVITNVIERNSSGKTRLEVHRKTGVTVLSGFFFMSTVNDAQKSNVIFIFCMPNYIKFKLKLKQNLL